MRRIGKIQNIYYGHNKQHKLGLHITLKGKNWKFTNTYNIDFLYYLLKQANVLYLGRLINIPIEAIFINNELMNFRIIDDYIIDSLTSMNLITKGGLIMSKSGIEVTLIGEDGNAFAIIGKVIKELKRNGFKDLADDYRKEAMAGDYNHLLRVTSKYVDIV